MNIFIRNALVIFFTVLSVVGCDESQSVGDFEERVKFEKKELYNALVSELDNRGIEYRVDESGFIYYPIRVRSEFNTALRSVIDNKVLNEFSVIFSEEKYADELIDEFQRENIPHRVEQNSGKTVVTWSKSVDVEARVIVDEQTRRILNK